MRRRELIFLLGGAAVAWPLTARAQQDLPVTAFAIRMLREQADDAAAKISQFIREIESQVAQLTWSASGIAQRHAFLVLLRQVPAITELAQLDPAGKEQLRVSRLTMDVIGLGTDFSQDPKFTVALAEKVYYGPVYFGRGSEPYMALSVASVSRDAGVTVVEISLKGIWDIVKRMKVGEHGLAYILDAHGHVVMHPDVSLIESDFSSLSQVQAARAAGSSAVAESVKVVQDISRREVLGTYAAVAPLGWLVFVEMPAEEGKALAK